jgi:hypothetical protein
MANIERCWSREPQASLLTWTDISRPFGFVATQIAAAGTDKWRIAATIGRTAMVGSAARSNLFQIVPNSHLGLFRREPFSIRGDPGMLEQPRVER